MAVKVNPSDYQDRIGFGELFTGPDFSQCLAWDDDHRIEWNNNPFCWDEVCIVLELIGGGSAYDAYELYKNWEEEKKKQFVTLYIKVKEQQDHIYTHEKRMRKEKITTSDVTVEDIEFVVESVLRPMVSITLEENEN